jgi:hypothetical protein
LSKQHLLLESKTVGLAVLFALLSGWPLYGVSQDNAALNKAAITAVEFSLAPDNLKQFGKPLISQEIVGQVTKNLAEWQFPVTLSAPKFSHKLVATVGAIRHDATPVGFSFSSGNTDPRATDYQQTDVLPISCQLSPIDKPKHAIQRDTTFSAQTFLGDASQSEIMHKLIDHISSLCFNLLDDLKLPVAAPKLGTTAFKPTWAPDIQVEVKQVPVKSISPITPKDIDAEGAKINTESTDEEGHKQLIIHNQGTPLIIEFGHERR